MAALQKASNSKKPNLQLQFNPQTADKNNLNCNTFGGNTIIVLTLLLLGESLS